MSKDLTPLQEINAPIWVEYDENSANDKLCYRRSQVNAIETALKALEIIKNKRVDVSWLFKCDNTRDYKCYSYCELTEKEFELLKEILK